ncbi:MAG: hypothetical protein Q9225_004899 [Loekoesia sp. 1 TL-2023]
MLKLVKSQFYKEPEFDQTDAPAKQPARAVDIFVGGPALVTYNHVTLTSATQFKRVLDSPLLNKTSTTLSSEGHLYHDRLYYEINWPFVRNALCRKFVKGIRNELSKAPEYENPDLAKFQEYIFDASLQGELRWSYLGTGSCSAGKFLAGKVILFNELHSTEDVVSFTDWLSPDADMSLWDNGHQAIGNTDDEATALRFLQNFLFRAWSGVNLKWDILIRCAEEHLASVVKKPSSFHELRFAVSLLIEV